MQNDAEERRVTAPIRRTGFMSEKGSQKMNIHDFQFRLRPAIKSNLQKTKVKGNQCNSCSCIWSAGDDFAELSEGAREAEGGRAEKGRSEVGAGMK